MSNFDKAVSLIYQAELAHIWHTNDLRSHPSIYVTALEEAGLLMPGLRIIRTLLELETLDADTWLMQADEDAIPMVVDDWIHDYSFDGDGIFPLVVMMDGAQVRAAREAMEEEHG